MNAEPQRPRDENPDDPDMPIKKDTAADHRPPGATEPDFQSPSKGPSGGGAHQNPDAKVPDQSQIQKQQRSPNMNTEKYKGHKGGKG